METASQHFHLPLLKSNTAPLFSPQILYYARINLGSAMRLSSIGDLPLKQAFSNQTIANNCRFQHLPKSFCVVHSSKIMATKTSEPPQDNLSQKKEEEKDVKKKVAVLPSPPEKPEPGDCCGSGCVRCVWDMYYEELEDYNKICESYSSDSKSS